MYKTPHITYVQNYFCTYLFLFIYGKYEQNPLTLEKSAFQRFEWVLSETFWENFVRNRILGFVYFPDSKNQFFPPSKYFLMVFGRHKKSLLSLPHISPNRETSDKMTAGHGLCHPALKADVSCLVGSHQLSLYSVFPIIQFSPYSVFL